MEVLFWSHVATLKSEGSSASLARDFVRRRLVEHHLPDLVEDVRLVVGELAHRLISQPDRPAFSVFLRGGGGEVLLTVQDGSLVSYDPLAGGQSTDGHALPLTQQLSERWGLDLAHSGRSVAWASFVADPAVMVQGRVPPQPVRR